MVSELVPMTNSALAYQPLAASPWTSGRRPLAGYSAVFARHTNAFCPSSFHVQPFRLRVLADVLWPLLTPARSAPSSDDGYQPCWRFRQISPDKSDLFPLMHPPQFTAIALGDFRLRCVMATRPAVTASNAIRVPRVESLPPASFRFHLAMDTLALG